MPSQDSYDVKSNSLSAHRATALASAGVSIKLASLEPSAPSRAGPLDEPGGPAPTQKILFCTLDDARVAAKDGHFEDDQTFLHAANVEDATRLLRAEEPSVVVVRGGSLQAVVDCCKQLRTVGTADCAVVIAVLSELPLDPRALIAAGASDLFVQDSAGIDLQTRILLAQNAAVGMTAARLAAASSAITIDSIGDGVIAMDVMGRVMRINPAAQRLTGWAAAEAKSISVREVFPLISAKTRAKLENPFDHTRREEKSVNLPKDILLVRRDGSEMPISDSCSPIWNSAGAFNGAVLVFRDLTAQNRAEAMEAQAQQQLVFTERMASLGALAAGIAHEINNPLTYTAINIDLALQQIRDLGPPLSSRLQEMEELLTESRDGAARIITIVGTLKALSRSEGEQPTVLDIVPVIEQSIKLASNEIRQRARMVTSYGDLPKVLADDVQLGQVFLNILVNAAQSFPPGSSAANEIRVVASTDARGWAVVEIADTGPGIAPAVLARVFNPFFTTKPIGFGTGLGLSISHGIVARMGGAITVDSHLGRGTTFKISLPPAPAFEAAPPAKTVVALAKRRPAEVLVVDDEAPIGRSIASILKSEHVSIVTSGEAALELLAAKANYDIVLSDLMMPGMSGMELFRAIAKLHPEMATKVVFMTGGAFTPEASTFLRETTNRWMNKPFASEQLRELVDSFVK